MPNTHCLTAGSLGSAEIPCCNVSAHNITEQKGAGPYRGVVVLLHGLSISIPPVFPLPIPADVTITNFNVYYATFAAALAADGWVVLHPAYPEDYYVDKGCLGIAADVTADTGHGSRFLATTLHWWDHLVAYIQAHYGNWPIVPAGFSWGAWHSLVVAANRQSTIVGYVAHAPVTILSNVNSLFLGGATFTNTTGLDLSATALNAVTVPGIVGYGTGDPAVGWQNPDASHPVSNTDAMITAAFAAGRPVTRNGTADFHEFKSADSSTYAAWIASTVDPLAPAVH